MDQGVADGSQAASMAAFREPYNI